MKTNCDPSHLRSLSQRLPLQDPVTVNMEHLQAANDLALQRMAMYTEEGLVLEAFNQPHQDIAWQTP